jgi:hypothetical protein
MLAILCIVHHAAPYVHAMLHLYGACSYWTEFELVAMCVSGVPQCQQQKETL